MTNLELLKLAKTWTGETIHGRKLSLEEALTELQTDDLIEVFGTWAVTFYGLECLVHQYPIEKSRITITTREEWLDHMKLKTWVNQMDFMNAFDFAIKLFHPPTPKDRKNLSGLNLRQRFIVFRRDNFRCQICGISAGEGARLEVDHIEAKSLGGTDNLKNFGTLCFECNRGKSNLTL